VILLASVGPECVNGWDELLAAPGTGQSCALVAWRLTPWIARAWLARTARRRGRPLLPYEHANWQVWGHPGRGHRPLWRTFLTEQRALLRELGELEHAIASVQAPVLLLADLRNILRRTQSGDEEHWCAAASIRASRMTASPAGPWVPARFLCRTTVVSAPAKTPRDPVRNGRAGSVGGN
jgi:hypothetical protein